METTQLAPAWGLFVLLIPVVILCLAQVVCFALVVAEMFKQGETGMGIACVALLILTGLGALFAYIYGWLKSSQWGLKRVMLVWTGCFLLNLLFVGVVGLASVGFPSG